MSETQEAAPVEEGLEEFGVNFPQTEEEQKGGGDKKFPPLPAGLYQLKIEEVRGTKHERGPMFGLMTKVVGGEHDGRIVWGNIIFLPYWANDEKTEITPGAGIARAFLKSVGKDYKGDDLKIQPTSWVGESFGARLRIKGDRNDIIAYFNGEEYQKALTAGTEALKEEEIF